MREVDSAIIGGGPAGLSAAVTLARMRRHVLVVDDRDGRSLWGHTNRNYLGFPEGIPAAEIRLAARRQAANYGVAFLAGEVQSAAREGAAFELRIDHRPEGSGRDRAGWPSYVKRDLEFGASLGEREASRPEVVRARTVIIASGVRDDFPRFPGWAECVGRSLFWCIACDGYESAGKVVVVVGHDEDAAETALDLLDFTPRVTLVAGRSDGFDLPPKRLADLRDNGVATHAAAVAAYPHVEGRIECLELDDAARTRVPAEMVFVYRRPTPRNEVALALGVAVNQLGHILVDTEAHTSVPGVYAAGDVTQLHDHQVSAAVHEGALAGFAANYYLYRPVQRHNGETTAR